MVVSAGHAGSRLDVFISTAFPELSRAMARRTCEDEKVRINGAPARAGSTVREGDLVELDELPQRAAARPELAEKESGPLSHISILFEDEHLLAVNKPRMMHSVTLKDSDPLTVADCIAAHSADCAQASSDPREAGLVQRLDFYTSGVMLAAKRPDVWEELHRMLTGEEVRKTYLALAEGEVRKQEVSIAAPLVDAEGGRRVEVSDEGRPAWSRIERLEVFRERGLVSSLLRVSGAGMRRHQVRAHLAHLGHPLLGDQLYGSYKDTFQLHWGGKDYSGQGFFLHAEQLALRHPLTGEVLDIAAPLPAA